MEHITQMNLGQEFYTISFQLVNENFCPSHQNLLYAHTLHSITLLYWLDICLLAYQAGTMHAS